jgi:hypothetical protein
MDSLTSPARNSRIHQIEKNQSTDPAADCRAFRAICGNGAWTRPSAPAKRLSIKLIIRKFPAHGSLSTRRTDIPDRSSKSNQRPFQKVDASFCCSRGRSGSVAIPSFPDRCFLRPTWSKPSWLITVVFIEQCCAILNPRLPRQVTLQLFFCWLPYTDGWPGKPFDKEIQYA